MNNEANDNANKFYSATSRGEAPQLQIVRVGSSYFGILNEAISSVIAWRKPTPLPHAPASILGVVSVGGRMLTVINLAMLPGAEVDSEGTLEKIVALRGDEQLALAVNEVGDMVEMPAELKAGKDSGQLIRIAFDDNGTEVKLLNVKQLFAHAIQGKERRHRRF